MSKATNLRKLKEAGFNVPEFVVIPADVLDAAALGIPPLMITAETIRCTPFPPGTAQRIIALMAQLPDTDLAVRSSMNEEDSQRFSYAGQLDSFLNVRGSEAVLARVRECWASAYGERANAYRKEHQLGADSTSMEVILQVMVRADVSGVIFTMDPAGRDPRWALVSACKGLGAALVQGDVPGETCRVNRSSGEVEGAVKTLTPEQLASLVSEALKIEDLFGEAQDIEFAIANGEISILQARPITTRIPTEHMIWDNSNITESYSGVTSPLTFSVIRSSYAKVYRQFLGLTGVRQMDEEVLHNLLGLYNGQVYYQLVNWYEALSWLPAFGQTSRFMEQMIGVKQSLGNKTMRRTGSRAALLAWVLRMTGLLMTCQRRVQDFLSGFDTVLAEYRAKDFAGMSPQDLHSAYLDLEKRVLGEWRAPILTDFFAMIFFGLLRRLSESWLDPGGSLHNDLLVGDGRIESLEPARRVQALARSARSDPRLMQLLEVNPSEALQQVRRDPDFSGFRKELDAYLEAYGDRCVNELKLEEPNLRDDPLPLLKLIGAAIKSPVEVQGEPTRSQAERRIRELSFLRRVTFRWILGQARRHIRNRENMRLARSRLFGLLRRIFNAVGEQWTELGVLDETRDIYYLTVSEIWDFVGGTAVTQNLKDLVALRRREFARYVKNPQPLPDRFETFGIPYLDEPRDLLRKPGSEGNMLQGVGCCSGHVRGRASVVRSATDVDSLQGDILVAERTDPGWVFLYPSAAGILVERGSPLSHSAIVAREMGKPIVVNIPHLTARLRTGDEVEMDGSRGTVRLLS